MTGTISRRRFLLTSATVGVATSLAPGQLASAASAPPSPPTLRQDPNDFRWLMATIAEMQAAMTQGETTARRLVLDHTERIEQLDLAGPTVNSIIELNPDAIAIAETLDDERV